jgi:hypothetical protein
LPTTSFTGATVETSIADADLVLIYDDSATAVRKMTKANLVAGIGGKVIQVVTATDSTERSTTSTSYVTGSNTLSVSITPSSTSNKILIVTSFLGFQGTGRGTWSLYRGATNLTTNGIMYNDWNSSAVNVYIGYSYLDSPSSTSSLTYQPYMKISSGTVYMNVGNSVGTITALEIAG